MNANNEMHLKYKDSRGFSYELNGNNYRTACLQLNHTAVADYLLPITDPTVYCVLQTIPFAKGEAISLDEICNSTNLTAEEVSQALSFLVDRELVILHGHDDSTPCYAQKREGMVGIYLILAGCMDRCEKENNRRGVTIVTTFVNSATQQTFVSDNGTTTTVICDSDCTVIINCDEADENDDDADNAMRFELGNMNYAKACMNLDYNDVAWYLSVLTNEAVFKTLTAVPSDSGNPITQPAICAQTGLPKAEVETALRILLKRNMISEADSNQHSADSDFEEPRYRQDYCGLCGIYMILAACKEHIDAKNAQKTETTIIRD